MKILIILSLAILTSSFTYAQNKKIVYKYKEYEKFDLGDLEIKGNIIAPGDLSVKERSRRVFERDLYRKNDFDKKIIQEIKFLR